ncbi:MAG: hypothetical protein ACREBE_11205 [bacterium]
MNLGKRIGNGLAVVGAVLAFVFAAYLLLVGPESMFVLDGGPIMTTHSPTPAGLIPLGIGVAALWAVATGRTSGFWVAAALAIAAAVLFLFSISLQLAAIAVLLLLAAVIRTITARDIHQR